MQEGFLDVAAGVVVKQFVVDGYSNDGDFFAVLCPCDDVELAVAVAHGTITGVELLMEQGLPAALLEYYLREIEGVWVDFVFPVEGGELEEIVDWRGGDIAQVGIEQGDANVLDIDRGGSMPFTRLTAGTMDEKRARG